MSKVACFQFQSQVCTAARSLAQSNGMCDAPSNTLSDTKYTKTRSILILAAVIVSDEEKD
jgi:hypothetical protein